MTMRSSAKGERTVLYVANGSTLGGGARVLTQAMLGLASPFRAELVVPGPGTFSEWAEQHGIPWYLAPSGGRLAAVGRVRTYRNALELGRVAGRAAILHAEAVTCFPPVGLIGRWLGVPRICHVQFPPNPGELARALRYGADAVVTVYEQQAREVRSDVPPGIPVLAIPNGIEVEHYQAGTSSEAREALRAGASHVAVLVGHVSEVKGYPTLIRAAAQVLRRHPGALFLCAGGETVGQGYSEKMRALAVELGIASRVKLLGPVQDIRPLLQAADVFVLPSEQEGLPLAALEAMSCGRPVVSTPVNGVPEAVVDGETGLLVPPGSPESLAGALTLLFDDASLRSRLGAAALQRVRQHFSVSRVQRRLNELYRSLSAQSAAPIR